MRNFLLLLLLFTPAALFAQITITDKVVSVTDKKPIANASVFLSNSKVGNMLLKDGSFTLSNVKNGQYDLVITCIGFEPLHQNIFVRGNDIQLPTIALKNKTSLLGKVKINGGKRKRDYKRERYIRIFTREFLGRTKNAAECKILNPDVLQFEYDESTDRMHAT
ncbi:carboxypeptidase-like regulatory domain-containing protein [Mucilaginibacter rigui]|uniref:Carboxypeptidase-like regulatory domain-containing protein n=1 Tax=Mucilaginibacter rigui TaxID=534635 RepID=A0ABR7X883_9SPHI|nr:carboxypeptidase-like regulatory domain-containing protein [Mucilaginibacter rigui]MBD1386796.1 carboxypeptidase-like regulatory domain-containing protein [Mucilaginibacter rigui]